MFIRYLNIFLALTFSISNVVKWNLYDSFNSQIISDYFNLTLENKNTYYLDQYFEFKGHEFYFKGESNIILLMPQKNFECMFSFKQNLKINFSNLFFVLQGNELVKINFVFYFQNEVTIFFEVILLFFIYYFQINYFY